MCILDNMRPSPAISTASKDSTAPLLFSSPLRKVMNTTLTSYVFPSLLNRTMNQEPCGPSTPQISEKPIGENKKSEGNIPRTVKERKEAVNVDGNQERDGTDYVEILEDLKPRKKQRGHPSGLKFMKKLSASKIDKNDSTYSPADALDVAKAWIELRNKGPNQKESKL